MNPSKLRRLIFMALCCDLGLFSKRLVGPIANLVTDPLHIPGGVATAFSLMFVTVAAALLDRPFCAGVMSAVQSALALSFGMVGSMGALAPIGYIMPGLVTDGALFVLRRAPLDLRVVCTNALAAVTASLTANAIVFHLHGPILFLYLSVSLLCGTLCGVLGAHLAHRLRPLLAEIRKDDDPMRSKKTILLLCALLLGITAATAVIHLSTRDKVDAGTLLVEVDGKAQTLPLKGLKLVSVKGERTNGKGEKIPVEGEGYLLRDVLAAAGADRAKCDHVELTADDGFAATVRGDESALDEAYLLREEDGTLRLTIFSDSDSKRNVSKVVKLAVFLQ